MHDRYVWMAGHNEKICPFFFGHLGSLRKLQYKKKFVYDDNLTTWLPLLVYSFCQHETKT